MELSTSQLFLKNSNAIIDICRPLSKIHITHFSYTKSYHSGQRVYFSTHPELLQSYFRNQFHLIGNCEFNPGTYRAQMLLWSTLPHQAIYEDARQRGIPEGFFIIKPHKDYTEFFNFAATQIDKNIANIYFSYIDVLTYIDNLKTKFHSQNKTGLILSLGKILGI